MDQYESSIQDNNNNNNNIIIIIIKKINKKGQRGVGWERESVMREFFLFFFLFLFLSQFYKNQTAGFRWD